MRRGLVILLVAACLGLAQLAARWMTTGVPLEGSFRQLASHIVAWWWWVAYIPLLHRLVRRVPLHERPLRALAAYAAAALACAALDAVLIRALNAAMGAPLRTTLGWTFLVRLENCLVLAGAIMGVLAAREAHGGWVAARTRAARLSEQLSKAQLEVMALRLHPHFLFNTLNTIAALVDQDRPAARATLRDLRDLLAVSFDRTVRAEVTLQEELQFVSAYLAIQQRRYRDLRVRVEATPDTRDALVPHLLLQPLVENAVRHGVERRRGPGELAVRAWAEGSHLHLEVCDDGPGPVVDRGERGVGLSNVEARLAQLPGRPSFALRARPGGGTTASIRLPLRRAGDEVRAA